ncbi:MAG: DUF2157 domain-containing protein [Candidatus Sungbacteria bacterium]|uniref:DUF2157 domain-containing protein n=1 Tax=Candidatus Sungiibacteriota bacterium TaxID=2750080 RepID=A0A931WPC4_9BACT|nr:DUF2157 domain-containing protein [Candidatus Sungbacteria bacterium]
MIDKSVALEQIKVWLDLKVVSPEELRELGQGGIAAATATAAKFEGVPSSDFISHKLGISEVLYAVGGLLVVMGVGVLVWQHWNEFSTLTRILITLGSAIAAYIVGLVMQFDKKLSKVGQAFFMISALVFPLGLAVTLDALSFDWSSYASQSLVSGVLLAVFAISYVFFRYDIFTLFSIIYGSWFYFSFTSYLAGSNPSFDLVKFYEYRILLLGLAFLSLGYFFASRERPALSSRLYGLGTLLFLGGAFALGGWKPSAVDSILWEIVFSGLALGIIFLSVITKSSSFLTLGVLFLMAYIVKITAEYFYESLGWELSLILSGLLLIFIGYSAVRVKKKFIA